MQRCKAYMHGLAVWMDSLINFIIRLWAIIIYIMLGFCWVKLSLNCNWNSDLIKYRFVALNVQMSNKKWKWLHWIPPTSKVGFHQGLPSIKLTLKGIFHGRSSFTESCLRLNAVSNQRMFSINGHKLTVTDRRKYPTIKAWTSALSKAHLYFLSHKNCLTLQYWEFSIC